MDRTHNFEGSFQLLKTLDDNAGKNRIQVVFVSFTCTHISSSMAK